MNDVVLLNSEVEKKCLCATSIRTILRSAYYQFLFSPYTLSLHIIKSLYQKSPIKTCSSALKLTQVFIIELQLLTQIPDCFAPMHIISTYVLSIYMYTHEHSFRTTSFNDAHDTCDQRSLKAHEFLTMFDFSSPHIEFSNNLKRKF